MNADTLLENFEILAEAPSGVAHLKQLILDLAITGKLVKSETTSISMERKIRQLWEQIPEKERESVRFRRSERMPFVLESTIPDHWISTFVEALTKLQTGATPSRAKPEYFKGNVKWLVSGDIKYSNISDCVGRISEKALRETNCKMIPLNSVLIALNGQGKTRATVSILRVEATCNQSLVSMTPRDPQILTCEFLYLFLRSKYKRIREITGADDRRGLNMNIVSSLQISVPPIAEQRQIVDRVDELLALCDELEHQQQQRDNLRTATRKSAIDAISTATTPAELEAAWKRINNNWEVIADTPESIDSIRNLINNLAVRGLLSKTEKNEKPIGVPILEGPFDLPPNWRWTRIGDVSNFVNGYAFPSGDYKEKGVGVVRMSDMKNGKIVTSRMKFVSEKYFEELSATIRVSPGDLVMGMTGATLGKPCFNLTSSTFLLNQRIGKFEPFAVDIEYLGIALLTLERLFMEVSFGTGVNNLSTKQIKESVFPIPPLEEQMRIVAKVDQLMALCDQLESELKARGEVAEKFARSVVNAA